VSTSRATRFATSAAAAVALSGALASCGGTGGTAEQASKARAKPAASVDYSARKMSSRATVSIASLRGTPILLTSFATWCTECRTELPDIARLAARYAPRGLKVIGVSVDEGSDAGSVAFAHKLGARFELLHDEHHHYQVTFRAVGVPQSELIDRRGRLVKVWLGGFDITSPETTRLIETVLAGEKGG
jgi:peroxiredoxin